MESKKYNKLVNITKKATDIVNRLMEKEKRQYRGRGIRDTNY